LVLAFLASLACVYGAILAVNVLGNARDAFPSPLCPTITERAWKTRRLLESVERGTPPQALVFGSSRMMQVQPEYVRAITGKRTFNYAVGSATPVDFLAQLRFALHANIKPDLLILGVDEFLFCEAPGPNLRLLGDAGLFAQVPFPENLDIVAEELGSIGVGDTARSLANLARLGWKEPRRVEDVEAVLLEDGYLIKAREERETRANTRDFGRELEATAVYYQQTFGFPAPNPPGCRPSPRKVALFREFLDLARANGIEMRVMLLPLHPAFEQKILSPELREVRRELDSFLREACHEHNFTYRNFEELASFGGSPDEFWDGSHLTPKNVRRMINTLFGIDPGETVAKLPADGEMMDNLPPVTTLDTL
jgi:hypothetical protein